MLAQFQDSGQDADIAKGGSIVEQCALEKRRKER